MLIRIFAFVWILLCSAASAATPPPLTVAYSADRHIETDSGDMQGSIAAAPGRERSEMRVGSMSTVMILHSDRQVGWMLMPMQRMYQELDFRSARRQAGSVPTEQVDLELVGSESVAGLAASKYRFVMKDKSAGGYLWFTAEGIPVKMDVISNDGGRKTRMTVTLENVRIGAQDPSLFEVPSGYAKLPGGGMFGSMSGLMPSR